MRNQLERNKRNDLKNKRNANTYHLALPAAVAYRRTRKAKTGEEEEQRSTVREENPKIEVVVWRLGKEEGRRRRASPLPSPDSEREVKNEGGGGKSRRMVWEGREARVCEGRRRWKR